MVYGNTNPTPASNKSVLQQRTTWTVLGSQDVMTEKQPLADDTIGHVHIRDNRTWNHDQQGSQLHHVVFPYTLQLQQSIVFPYTLQLQRSIVFTNTLQLHQSDCVPVHMDNQEARIYQHMLLGSSWMHKQLVRNSFKMQQVDKAQSSKTRGRHLLWELASYLHGSPRTEGTCRHPRCKARSPIVGWTASKRHPYPREEQRKNIALSAFLDVSDSSKNQSTTVPNLTRLPHAWWKDRAMLDWVSFFDLDRAKIWLRNRIFFNGFQTLNMGYAIGTNPETKQQRQ